MKFDSLIDISHLRLQNQYLSGDPMKKPAEIVEWLGAVQSQDYAGAKWSLGLRLNNFTDKDLDESFNKGEILRTHVLRPTWHFVTPQNIRWMLELTAPRVKILLNHYDKRLGIDEAVKMKTQKIIISLLTNNNYLTRDEIKQQFLKNNIIFDDYTKVQALAHMIMHAELDGIICSGPRKGKQFTYALLEERVPSFKKVTRDESLATLALKYFQSHGPAQIKDFSWWSGLTIKDATEGLNFVKSKLSEEVLEDKTHYFSKDLEIKKVEKPKIFLLSIYDEYTIAYKDRSALGGERYVEKFISMGNALTAVVILDGKVVGTWKRSIQKNKVLIKVDIFIKLNTEQKEALHTEAKKYGVFVGAEAVIEGV